MGLAKLEVVPDLAGGDSWDAVVVVCPDPIMTNVSAIDLSVARARAVDRRVDRDLGFLHVPELAGERLIIAPTGPLSRDHDDARRFGEAARVGIRRAMAAGARRPLLVIRGVPNRMAYGQAEQVAVLEALSESWGPLEAREARGEAVVEPLSALGWVTSDAEAPSWKGRLEAVEKGRRAARDITGTEPERMAPARVAEYCLELFRGSSIDVSVIRDRDTLEQEYPLVTAVGRASFAVPRHHPCVIRLSYEAEGPIEQTLLFAGKGVTYDTGGADVKYGGAMAGMSRDKGGAGAVIGFMKAVAETRPPGLRVLAEVGAVRNSMGADAFVTDEIITSHAGVRVRVGNTDAEGRLVLADLLSHLRAGAAGLAQPHLFSIATLTGHVGRAVGTYSVAIDNGPARALGTAERMSRVGDLWADPFEISRLRREDWDFVRPRTVADDVLSCNTAPSTATPRGHQFPMAFMAIASGLDRHGQDGAPPLSYTHIDIGGSAVEAGDWQHGRPTGSPVAALAFALLECLQGS